MDPWVGTWSGSLSLHSELQVNVRRKGVTRTSPLKFTSRVEEPGRTLRYSPSQAARSPAGGPAVFLPPPKPFPACPHMHTPTCPLHIHTVA